MAALLLASGIFGQGATADERATVVRLPSGGEFGTLGAKPATPAPTLFVFANDFKTTLQSKDFNEVGQTLRAKGIVCVSIDLPCHGADRHDDEPEGLAGWRVRLEKGDDPIAAACARASEVLDYLVREGYSDRDRVAACGTSRGGFVALHFAAAEPRVRCVAAFAPVTDLRLLREFNGMMPDTPAARLVLKDKADALATKPVWIVIGPHDERVGTDSAIALARSLTASAVRQKRPSLVELHVEPAEGHRTPAGAHVRAATWLARHLEIE